jgi:hypothetical protein
VCVCVCVCVCRRGHQDTPDALLIDVRSWRLVRVHEEDDNRKVHKSAQQCQLPQCIGHPQKHGRLMWCTA